MDILREYRIVSVVSSRAGCESYRVSDPSGRSWFLKRARRAFFQDDFELANEAGLMKRLRTPVVPRFVDHFVEQSDECLVLEWIEGMTLRQVCGSPVPTQVAMALAVKSSRAIALLHEAADDGGQPFGLVHRDLSPENLMYDFASASIRVLDLGISTSSLGSDKWRTRTGEFRGKLSYTSPEQAIGQIGTQQSDVFSWSLVVREMFEGKPVHVSRTLTEAIEALVYGAHSKPCTGVTELDELLEQCGRREPSERPTSMATVSRELDQISARCTGWDDGSVQVFLESLRCDASSADNDETVKS